MIKGKALVAGDTIGIIAPASPAKNHQSMTLVQNRVEALGFDVVMAPSCFETYGDYLAGTAEDRARDLNVMFRDPEIDAIMCLRGGYGTPQILDLLDYPAIQENPKLFIGYSDITALHVALGQKAGLATLHGPMAASDIAESFGDFSRQGLLRACREGRPLGKIENPPDDPIECLVEGKAEGRLTGGNLSLIAATLGTPFEIDTKGKILFLEDVGEEPYRIDRMLMQLSLAGKLADAAGFVLGDWADCESREYPEGFTVLDLFTEIIVPYQKPVIYNVKAGHCEPKLTLPLGVEVQLDAGQKWLSVEESVVEKR